MARTSTAIAVVVAVVALMAAAASGARTVLTDRLSLDRSSVSIAHEPPGTRSIGVALMRNLKGAGLRYTTIPASQRTYTPPPATPVVDMVTRGAGGAQIGSWAGRLRTTPGGVRTIVDQLASPHSAIHVTAEPRGTAYIRIALMNHMSGGGLRYLRIPGTTTTYTPPAGTPVVDLQAYNAAGAHIGAWAGRLQTVPAKASRAKMIVSLNAGGWGPGELTDLAGVVGTLRIDTVSDSEAAAYATAGYDVVDDIHGPYDQVGVSGLDASGFAADALARWRADPNIVAIEETNEPAGSWFWGPEATSATNATAYANLLHAVYERFAPYGSARPKLLAAWESGGGGWGPSWLRQIDRKWIDGVTVHPYGGTASRRQSALGDRGSVEAAHRETGLPVWVTEIGWPTAVGQPSTSDSLQWTEAQQAANISSFVKWCRTLGYVADVTVFGYRDYGSNTSYGIETWAGDRKFSYGVVGELSRE